MMMETKEEERWAVFVDGIKIPGFVSKVEAVEAIKKNLKWQAKGAEPVKLLGQIKSEK